MIFKCGNMYKDCHFSLNVQGPVPIHGNGSTTGALADTHLSKTRGTSHAQNPSLAMQLQAESDSQGCCSQINGVCCPPGNMCEQSGMSCNSDCCSHETPAMMGPAPILTTGDTDTWTWAPASQKFWHEYYYKHALDGDSITFDVQLASRNSDKITVRGG